VHYTRRVHTYKPTEIVVLHTSCFTTLHNVIHTVRLHVVKSTLSAGAYGFVTFSVLSSPGPIGVCSASSRQRQLPSTTHTEIVKFYCVFFFSPPINAKPSRIRATSLSETYLTQNEK